MLGCPTIKLVPITNLRMDLFEALVFTNNLQKETRTNYMTWVRQTIRWWWGQLAVGHGLRWGQLVVGRVGNMRQSKKWPRYVLCVLAPRGERIQCLEFLNIDIDTFEKLLLWIFFKVQYFHIQVVSIQVGCWFVFSAKGSKLQTNCK